MWGTEQVWPRSPALPNLLNVTNPPLVTVRVGDPVDLKYRSPDADTKRIMTAISDLLPKESRQKRTPTAEELARTYPPGLPGRSPGRGRAPPGDGRLNPLRVIARPRSLSSRSDLGR